MSKLVEHMVANQLLELPSPYTQLSLLIGKHKGIKFHFSGDDTQVCAFILEEYMCCLETVEQMPR